MQREADIPIRNAEHETFRRQPRWWASEFLALPTIAGLILRALIVLLTTIRVARHKTDNTTPADVAGRNLTRFRRRRTLEVVERAAFLHPRATVRLMPHVGKEENVLLRRTGVDDERVHRRVTDI